MPQWTAPPTPASSRVRVLHRELTGQDPAAVADAPATFAFMGEHTDHAGGVVIMGLSSQRAAVAWSPRADDVISVSWRAADTDSVQEDSTTHEAVEKCAAAHEANEVTETPTPALRLGGLVWTLIQRQLLSRDTPGLNITVVSDIPAGVGLGADAAVDTATALALLAESTDLSESPMRARIADVTFHAAGTFGTAPALRARYTAALRGVEGRIAIIDYADGSVTQAAHPITDEVLAFNLSIPSAAPAQGADTIRAQQTFVAEACHAFGTDSLRQLPDALPRVVDWLAAVHKVRGTEGTPTEAEARQWLSFLSEEVTLTQNTARALRSRRGSEISPLVARSQAALSDGLSCADTQDVVSLCVTRGALAARAASACLSTAVTALVPATKATNFAADLSEDGFLVIPITAGSRADVVAED